MTDDTMSIFDWWMRPAEFVAPAIHALTEESYRWPPAVRRAYVMTWPVAIVVRILAILALMFIHVILGGAGYVCAALNCILLGKRTPWQ